MLNWNTALPFRNFLSAYSPAQFGASAAKADARAAKINKGTNARFAIQIRTLPPRRERHPRAARERELSEKTNQSPYPSAEFLRGSPGFRTPRCRLAFRAAQALCSWVANPFSKL